MTTVSLRDRIGLALVNASDLLEVIRPYASRIIVLHGHRHTDWIGTYGNIVLCSAPSAALGSQLQKERHSSFRLHRIGFNEECGIQLLNSERMDIDERISIRAGVESRAEGLAA
jgi:hypothetical protein